MRVRASTLLETIISMGLMGCVLATSGVIFSNVLHGDRSGRCTRAELAFARWRDGLSPSAPPKDDVLLVEGLTVAIHCEPIGTSSTRVRAEARSEDGALIWDRRILFVP